jgi:DNA-binding transcriptional MerR regulator
MAKPIFPQGLFSMCDAAAQVGVTKNTLFNWERQNKIDKPRRDRNKYRTYTADDIAKIKKFKDQILEPESVTEQ